MDWSAFGARLLDLPELGFRLDLSRMSIDDETIEQFEPRFAAAFEAMQALESGAIANPDEQRMVGHYWLRDSSIAPTAEIREEVESVKREIATFAQRCHQEGRFDQLLVIGIGGSALGPQFVADALGGNDKMRPFFIDNTDPDGMERLFKTLGDSLSRTLAVVISKSGGTPETRNGMLVAQRRYEEAGLRFGEHAVAITGVGSKLDRYAEEQGFIARFPMQDWVGGRTSETSVVGLLPAALQGIDIDALLEGAAAMDRATRVASLKQNPAALLALAWHVAGNGRGDKEMVILPYRDRLQLFSRYLQQLVMESIGKEKDRQGRTVLQGIAVYGNKGSTDQHAYVQQLRDGLPNFFATFIDVLDDDGADRDEVDPGVTSGDYLTGFLLGTRQALFENGRGSITLRFERLTPQAVGMMIALYERAVGLYAELIDINAYHQPGVEAGKKAAAAVLEIQQALVEAMKNDAEARDAAAWAERIGKGSEIETVFHLLDRWSVRRDRPVERLDAAEPTAATYRWSEA